MEFLNEMFRKTNYFNLSTNIKYKSTIIIPTDNNVSYYKLFSILTLIYTIINLHMKNKVIHLKSHVKNINVIKSRVILSVLSLLSFILFLPVLLATLTIFGLYRKFVTFVLKLKCRTKFGGLLEGTDAFWAIEDISKSVINIMLIINFDGNPTDFHNIVKRNVYKKFYAKPNKFPKFSSIRKKCLGYYYFLNDEFNINDCICDMNFHSIEEYINKKQLQQILSDCSNKPLPKNHSGGLEIIVGNKPVCWKNNNVKQYPIIVRIHHSLVDGLSLLKMFVGCFADEKNVEEKKESENIPINNKCLHRKSKLFIMKEWFNAKFRNCCVLSFAPAVLILQQIMRAKDDNILHGPELSGEKQVVWNVEVEPKYVNVIKNIKRNVPGTTFSDVIMTAISASFNEYYKKNSTAMPEVVTTIIPAIPQISDLPKIIPGKYDNQDTVLHNRFSVGMLNLPVYLDSRYCLRDRLMKVKHQLNTLKNSPDFQVNYWLLKIIFAVLPVSILKPIINSAHSTVVISNLPGPQKLTLFNGNKLDDIVFWIPHRGTTGIGISILSYDGRFQLGMLVDKVLISNEEKAQSLLDNIYNYLELLNEECLQMYEL